MAKDSPSFTIPVSPEAEYLLDRYLEELKQFLLLNAALNMAHRIGDSGIEVGDVRSSLQTKPMEKEQLDSIISIVATEWNDPNTNKPNT